MFENLPGESGSCFRCIFRLGLTPIGEKNIVRSSKIIHPNFLAPVTDIPLLL